MKQMDQNQKRKMNPAGKALLTFGLTAGVLLLTAGLLVGYVDPFFHYHAPLSGSRTWWTISCHRIREWPGT